MALIDYFVQGCHMVLVLALAPLLTGWVRWVTARLLRRRGQAPLTHPRDPITLLR